MKIKKEIKAIAHYIQEHIDLHCETVWSANEEKFVKVYEEMGDLAYGQFLGLLFKPVSEHLKSDGFKLKPKLPGNLNTSREWGTNEIDRQRWMWCAVKGVDGSDYGTIVLKIFHDHTEFRLPRKPAVLFLYVTDKQDVIRELSKISSDFAKAMDMKMEYAEYLANLDKTEKIINDK
jgi:Family of unknown function (DUF6022)